MVKSTSFLLNRGDTFVRTAMSIKFEKNKIKRTRTKYAGIHLVSCEPALS